MKNISNTIDRDAIVISDNKAIQNLEPGNIYLFSEDANLKNVVDIIKANLDEVRDPKQQLYNYNIVCLKDADFINEESNLYYPVQNGCNMILPLYTPNSLAFRYLTMHFSIDSLEEDIVSAIFQADNYTKESWEDAFINMAVQEPDTCRLMLEELQSNFDEGFSDGSSLSSLFSFSDVFNISGVYGIANIVPSTTIIEKAFSKVSSKSSNEIFKRFIDNCKTIKTLDKKRKPNEEEVLALTVAKRELDFVFKTIWGIDKNIESFRRNYLGQTDRMIKYSYENYIDRIGIAEKSRIKLFIKDCRKEKSSGTNGKYRIYAQKDGCEPVLVKFTRKPSCIVYLMYLLHMKQKGQDVDTLKISNNKELFCKLYSEVYNTYDAESTFVGLIAHHIDGVPRKARLTNCYDDIRKSLTEIIDGKFSEEVLPFIIPNENSHITIMDKNIEVPEELKNMQFA